ncbi:MAG: hypothetical protein LV479_06040 [Methylacidiphilales bacterium]|nr:hypothetical protein [Candidatus Methylacidiphilales bacterium]
MSVQVFGDDWTTTDGKVYNGVQVVKVEDDAVTILYANGGALIPFAKLPPNLQKKFNYDPVKAKAAADARAKADAVNALRLQKEIDQAQKLKQDQMILDAKQKAALDGTATKP